MPKRKNSESRPKGRFGLSWLNSKYKRYKTEEQANVGSAGMWGAAAGVLVSLFTVASVLTDWTGTLGVVIKDILLGAVGGASLIPVLFILYLCISKLLGKKVPFLLRQWCGVVVLMLDACIFFGLLEITVGPMPALLSAGEWGRGITNGLIAALGPLGITMAGLAMAGLTFAVFRTGATKPQDGKSTESAQGAGERRSKDLEAHETHEKFEEDEVHERYDELEDEPLPTVTNRITDALSGIKDMFSHQAKPQKRRFKPEEYDDDTEYVDGGYASDDTDVSRETSDYDDEPYFAPHGMFPPPLELLGPAENDTPHMWDEEMRPLMETIKSSLAEFGVEANVVEAMAGPTVVQFRMQLGPGMKVSRVMSLSNDLALALAVPGLRVAPIPGTQYVGVEIPNKNRRTVSLRYILESEAFSRSEAQLPLPLGVSVNGVPCTEALEDMPHMLVAGTTGSGKSVFINTCIVGLCSVRTPEELRLVLIDPKRVEMAPYSELPHILTPPVTDTKAAVQVLGWATKEMERRYEIFSRHRVRNLKAYNELADKRKIPHIVVVVDELADLMMTSPKEVEDYICRLAQMARATGIHLILATQRPSVNVITGLIKANIPSRVAFSLPTQADSRTVLDGSGAEKLMGKGDMLYLSPRSPKPLRLQSACIEEQYLHPWLDYMSELFGKPRIQDLTDGGYSGGDSGDSMLEDAVDMVMSSGIASASRLQRQLKVGFTRAARLIDTMESMGMVGPPEGARPREILVDKRTAAELMRKNRQP